MRKKFSLIVLLLLATATAFAAGEHGTLVRGTTLYVSPGATSEKLMQVERGRDMVVLERTNMDNAQWMKVFVTIVQGESQRDVTGWLQGKGVVTVSTPNGDQIIFGEAADSENQAEQRGGRKGAAAGSAAGNADPAASLAAANMGYLHCGPSGAGHFVKMVHNGIEYGLMAAYAEGLNLLAHADAGRSAGAADAETAPLSDPQFFQYQLDLAAITEVWRHGSIISSRLLDLTAAALARDGKLAGFAGHVSDSGEGRWTVEAAIEVGVPAPVLSAALYARFESRGHAEFANKLLSAMRLGFGGHVERGA